MAEKPESPIGSWRADSPSRSRAEMHETEIRHIGTDVVITACLYAYSHLSFSNGRFARVSACHYHRLREYMFEHVDVKSILQSID